MKNKTKIITILSILIIALVLINGAKATNDKIQEKIANCEPKVLAYTKMVDIPTNGQYNQQKQLYPFWDGWSLNWFIKNKCYETLTYCQGNITVLNDLGNCNNTQERYTKSIEEQTIRNFLTTEPYYKCKVGSCANSGWKDKLYTYKTRQVCETIGYRKVCIGWFCWKAPINECHWEGQETHTIDEWTEIARDTFNNENITKEEVESCITTNCLNQT